jgi:hypothetical protein
MTTQNSKKSSSRILTFDLMRGYFLVAIILNHLTYFPSGLDWWGGRGNLYVSAAEGFFLISGIVLGVVRGRKLIDKPLRVGAKLLLKRSLQLYVTAVVLMLIFTGIGWLFIDNPGVKPGLRPIDENIFTVIKGALIFEYIYGWADYLRLYALFLLASPVALWLLRRKLWFVVLAISIFVWTRYSSSTLASAELSQVYSWQLIFFSGFIIGFHFDAICAWWVAFTPRIRKVITATTVLLAGITMLLSFFIVEIAPLLGGAASGLANLNTTLEPYFLKEQLPLARLLLFAIWFGAGYWLFWRFEPAIKRYLGWLLLPFGTNSLYVYTLHAFVVYGAHLLIKDASPYTLVNLILSIAAIGLIWFPLQQKFLMNIIPR